MPFQKLWRKAFPESHNPRMEPTLPSLPLRLDTDGLMTAREQALDFISFVAWTYPPAAAAADIRREHRC
jgi:hypothetical protein